jgi:hypothetical protein
VGVPGGDAEPVRLAVRRLVKVGLPVLAVLVVVGVKELVTLRVGVTARPGATIEEMSGHSWSPSVRLAVALPDVVANTAHMPPGPSERSMYG